MRIVPHEELRRVIGVKLTVLPGYVQRETGFTHLSRNRMLDAIMSAMAGCLVVAPDLAPDARGRGMPGRFGETEPHPFPELVGDER